jgi:hypothetical protein
MKSGNKEFFNLYPIFVLEKTSLLWSWGWTALKTGGVKMIQFVGACEGSGSVVVGHYWISTLHLRNCAGAKA